MTNVFSHEYDPNSIKAYHTAGFKFFITPRFKSHYIDSLHPYEWLTVKAFNASIQPGDTVIDIGAHYGYYTLNAAREAGKTGRVVSVEPVSFNKSILEKNVDANGFKSTISVLDSPVSNTEGKVAFNITEASDNGGFYNHPNTRVVDTIETKAITLRSLLQEAPGTTVVKIDAEGHECEILESGEELLKSIAPLLFLEFNPKCLAQAKRTPGDFFGILKRCGYKVLFIDDRNNQFFQLRKPAEQWTKIIDPQSYINIIAVPTSRYRAFIKSLTPVFRQPLKKL